VFEERESAERYKNHLISLRSFDPLTYVRGFSDKSKKAFEAQLQNMEVIVVDKFSTDGTKKIAES
jgi:hypothetical protein